MRETRLSGSEGGGTEFNRFSLPLSWWRKTAATDLARASCPRRKIFAAPQRPARGGKQPQANPSIIPKNLSPVVSDAASQLHAAGWPLHRKRRQACCIGP
jgi:hypothetical protein